jgi:hypothetical protein
MARVYVATRFGLWRDADRAHELLRAAGHEPTSGWVEIARELDGRCDAVPIGDPRRKRNAENDLRDLCSSDALLLLVPAHGGTGMWVELGYAIHCGMRCVCVGPALERTVFCELTENYATVEQAVEALNDRRC